MAEAATEREMQSDIEYLTKLWNDLNDRARDVPAPALLYQDLNLAQRVLRDMATEETSRVIVDSRETFTKMLAFAREYTPALIERIEHHPGERPLFDLHRVEDEIEKALARRVDLKSGGYLIVDQTEAMTTIDVNTGGFVGGRSFDDTIFKTNLDAAQVIARQLRLRNLGGIIIIDFIDMDERRNRQKVMQALEEALRSDRAPSKVLQFNDFGLVAITRKRVKQSLERTIGTPCPYCESTGFVKSVTTICNEIYLEMRKIAKHLEHVDVMLRVNPEVAKALKNNNGKLLTEMEEMSKRTVIVKSDPALHQEQFDIN
jgi:ribonuclease G